ncbi:MAG: HlyD family efflux transporter periplasmic adaptor subunit [Cyclobacteriaceae bacterium]|nr:HlyD family efflux transporter periplasmic adaptor subunit [Cyclobacteriaceae bacterium HetDA_MAG_MS6]
MQRIIMKLMIVTLLGALISCSSNEESKEAVQIPKVQQRVRSFNTLEVDPKPVNNSINITGRVVPLQKFDVIAQVQGFAKSTGKSFKAGVDYVAGQTLIHIEDDEFRNNLSAQKSQFLSSLVRIMSDLKVDYPNDFPVWKEYLTKVSIEQPLPTIPKVSEDQLKYYLAANNIYNLYYSIRSAEKTLEKYRIRAPFDGSVVQSSIDIGSLVNPNVKLGEFIRTDEYEIRATLSFSEIESIREGQQITFYSPDIKGQWVGHVARIGSRIDPASQAVPIYLTVEGSGLKEGMYLEAAISSEIFENAVELSKDFITRNNQVYLIKDSIVQLRKVNLLAFNSNTVLVDGLKRGDKVIVDPINSPIQGIVAVSK